MFFLVFSEEEVEDRCHQLEEKLAKTTLEKRALEKKVHRAKEKTLKLSAMLEDLRLDKLISAETHVALEKYDGKKHESNIYKELFLNSSLLLNSAFSSSSFQKSNYMCLAIERTYILPLSEPISYN